MRAVYELEALMLTGHCFDAKTREPPRGLQMALGSARAPRMVDTIVMANLGYFQLKAAPGVWNLSLVPGRSTELYALAGGRNAEGQDGRGVTREVVVSDFRGGVLHLGVAKRPGKEKEKLLEADEEKGGGPKGGSESGAEKGGGVRVAGDAGAGEEMAGVQGALLSCSFQFCGRSCYCDFFSSHNSEPLPLYFCFTCVRKGTASSLRVKITKFDSASFIGGRLKLTLQESRLPAPIILPAPNTYCEADDWTSQGVSN
jgi:hypothetical protein